MAAACPGAESQDSSAGQSHGTPTAVALLSCGVCLAQTDAAEEGCARPPRKSSQVGVSSTKASALCAEAVVCLADLLEAICWQHPLQGNQRVDLFAAVGPPPNSDIASSAQASCRSLPVLSWSCDQKPTR